MTLNEWTMARYWFRRVSQNHKTQKPELDRCPSCHQHLQGSISNLYSYYQDENNTEQEIKNHRVLIKAVQSDVNSLQKSILEKKAEISQEYSVIAKYSEEEVSYEKVLYIIFQNLKLVNSG